MIDKVLDISLTNKSHSILFISALDVWSLGKGKGGPALYKTLIGYAIRGWKVYFITGNGDGVSGQDIHENVQIIRFDAHWLKSLLQIKKVGFLAKGAWWLYFQSIAFFKAICLKREHKFDVVYGYEIFGVPVAKLLAIFWQIPMVSRFQGTIIRANWQKGKLCFMRAWQHFLALKIPSDLTVMTDDGTQGDKVLLDLGVDMNRVRFWMNGVDWSLFGDLPMQQKAKGALDIEAKYVLLTVSRLVGWKRVDRAIKALPDIISVFPSTVLVIIGDGEERENLKELASKLGVAKHIYFEGAVNHDEVAKYFAVTDIFLSLYDLSNVGNPLLEAMMTGRCIVTLNNGDTRRFINTGENGILLQYEDLPKLPKVIIELLADDERREFLGANARQFAKEKFWTWEDRIAAEVTEVEKLLEQWNNR